MNIPTPQLFKGQNFQAWALFIVLLLVIVIVWDSYTGKKMLSFISGKPKTDPARFDQAPKPATKPMEAIV